VIEDPTITGLRALRIEVSLGKAISLSCQQARETWRAMQLLATQGAVEGVPEGLVQLAMEFNRCPLAWKVVADKALSKGGPGLAKSFSLENGWKMGPAKLRFNSPAMTLAGFSAYKTSGEKAELFFESHTIVC